MEEFQLRIEKVLKKELSGKKEKFENIIIASIEHLTVCEDHECNAIGYKVIGSNLIKGFSALFCVHYFAGLRFGFSLVHYVWDSGWTRISTTSVSTPNNDNLDFNIKDRHPDLRINKVGKLKVKELDKKVFKLENLWVLECFSHLGLCILS